MGRLFLSVNGTLFEPSVLTAFISTGTEPELWIAVGSKLSEKSRDCVEPVLSSFHYSNKKYDRGGKNFSPFSCLALVWSQFLGRSSRSLVITVPVNRALN